MINIRCESLPDGFSVIMAGHANYGRRGTDIVCAGVSALAGALYKTVCKKYSEGLFTVNAVKLGDGIMYIKACGCKSERARDILMSVFETFCNGISAIAKGYSSNVSYQYCSNNTYGYFTDNDTPEKTAENKSERR